MEVGVEQRVATVGQKIVVMSKFSSYQRKVPTRLAATVYTYQSLCGHISTTLQPLPYLLFRSSLVKWLSSTSI